MELKELTSAEQVVMKCIWDYGKDMPLQQLINYLIEEQDYKEQELEKTKNFWYKESGFDLVKTLYKGKLNEGKLKKLKKLLEEIDD